MPQQLTMDQIFANAFVKEVKTHHLCTIHVVNLIIFYFAIIGATSQLSDDHDDFSDAESDDDMIFIDLGEILDSRSRFTGSRQVTLPVHRRCACHLLNLVSKVDVEKITDGSFNDLRMNVEDKLDILWNKQSSSSNNSDTIKRHLGQLFVLKNDTRWNTRYYATACVVRLIRKKEKALRKLMEELKIPYFSPSEEQYMKEYVKVMPCVVDALDILQGEKNVGLGFLLPTLTVLKSNLQLLQDDPSVVHCQPLIASLLTSINIR